MRFGSKRSAFTLVEVVVVLMAIGALSAIAFFVVSNLRQNAIETVLRSQVESINKMLGIFEGNGGNLANAHDMSHQAIVDMLKGKFKDSHRLIGVGSDSLLREDLRTVSVAAGDPAWRGKARAVWNRSIRRFVVVESEAAGTVRFIFGETESANTNSTNASTLENANEQGFAFASDKAKSWVWDTTDRTLIFTRNELSSDLSFADQSEVAFGNKSGTAAVLAQPLLHISTGGYLTSGGTTAMTYDKYPASIRLVNPNPSDSSVLRYQINGGVISSYEEGTLLSLKADDSIKAWAMSISENYEDSSESSHNFTYDQIALKQPEIILSSLHFEMTRHEHIEISFNNPNDSKYNSFIEYKILPKGALTEDYEWTEYSGAIKLDRRINLEHVDILARVRSNSPKALATSNIASERIGRVLDPPIVNTEPIFNSDGDIIRVRFAIENPNLSSFSQVRYLLLAPDSDLSDAEFKQQSIAYTSKIIITREQYDQGWTLLSYTKAITDEQNFHGDRLYIDSAVVSNNAQERQTIPLEQNVIFILDNSESMRRQAWGFAEKRVDVARDTLKQSINNLPNGAYFSLIIFSTNASEVLPYNEASDISKANAISIIDNHQNPNLLTMPGSGLNIAKNIVANQKLGNRPIEQVVIFSDGEHSGGYQDRLAYLNTAKSIFQEGARIDSMAINTPEYGQHRLQEISDVSGGLFQNVAR